MAIKVKDSNGKWVVVDQKAIETPITDLGNNFKSDNVEGALRELAEKQKKGESDNINEIKQQVDVNKIAISNLQNRINIAEEDIEWLRANNGGGAGTIVPTITSTFQDTSVNKGENVIIPIFFSAPIGGNGTAYISVNNVEVDTVGVRQGNSNITILGRHLMNTINEVSIYVRDRNGTASNQLDWKIIAGGIELTTTFNYEADWGITDEIKIPYRIDTAVEGDIVLHLTIDDIRYDIPSNSGYNEYSLKDLGLGLGTHKTEMYATISQYESKKIAFNIVIVSTTELYLSSTFDENLAYNYGSLISIPYRLSKKTTELYNIVIMINNEVKKEQQSPVGSYAWTIPSDTPIGNHLITIRATSLDGVETVSLFLELNIVKGEYAPVEDYKKDLLCDLNAIGKSNLDLNEGMWLDESGNNHHGQLVNFNFATNGFVDDTLVCDNDAYVVIPWSPWSQNAITGSTIDIIYTPINSGIEEARIIDYTEITDPLSEAEIKPFKGLFADIVQTISASASSGTNAGKVNLDDESGEIHLTWVLDRDNKFMKTYINGVLSRIMYLTDSGEGINKFYEDFSHNNYIYLNSNKGETCGTNNIKRFRVYGHALTSDEVLQNHLANIRDLAKQEKEYDFNYNNATLPIMRLFGDTTNMTHEQTVDMRIEYLSPNEEKYGMSFNTGIPNNPVCIQGTSSLQYVRKNYTIYLKDEYGVDMLYNPYGEGSAPDNVFCLKADYVESSHANNTGLAKFVNDCVYDTKLPTQLRDPNYRCTINGFPIRVFLNGEDLGVYNLNYDRYSNKAFGYDNIQFPNLLVYEINSNSNTSAGAFFRYGENAESSGNVTELEYYKRDFNLIYGNRTADSDSYSEIKTLVEWVSVADQDLFRETLDEHFNREYLFRYYLTVLLIGGVDSLGKNCKLFTNDGRIWYPLFYDMDTTLGIDNTGYLTVPSDVEIESGSFNTSNSNLWSKVWNFFNAEIKQEWELMRKGKFTLDNIMSYIYGEQISQIPAKMYNDDAQIKYLDFGSLYTYCCHGNKEHLIKRWLRERIEYVDSMMGYFVSQDDQITIRLNKEGFVSFDVTTYIPLYFSVKWSNATNGTQTIKMKRGETKTFSYTSTTNTDQEVIIPFARYIKRLDNLSNLNPSSAILSNAVKLTNVEIHSTELYNINLTNNRFLRRVDLRDCPALGTVQATGSILDLTNCRYLQYADLYNTALTEINLDTLGGSLVEIYYPKSLQSLTLIKQRLVKTVGLPYGNIGEEVPTGLYTINIQDCPSIEKLNTSTNNTIAKSFASMVYCNNLTLRNSLDLKELTFDAFHRLKNVTIENMSNLVEIKFNNLLKKGGQPTLQYVGLSNCPKLIEIEMNCSSNNYEITFVDGAILDFGKLSSLKTLKSNCVIKGLETIVCPKSLEGIYFTLDYGEGNSSIKNVWSSENCNVNTSGTLALATHIVPGFEGIDFKNMTIKAIDMLGFGRVKNAINFNIAPTNLNPNLNTARDGSNEYPWFRPTGIIDLTNYELEWRGIFKGLDLDKVIIVMPDGNLEDTDISSLFEGTVFRDATMVNQIINKFSNANNFNYIFRNSDLEDASNIAFPTNRRFTLQGGFANSKLTKDIDFPPNVINVADCFRDCIYMTEVTSNWDDTYTYAMTCDNCYKGCINITKIDRVSGRLHDIPVEWGGYGFDENSVGTYTVEIPYDDFTLEFGDTIKDGNIDWGDGSHNEGNINYHTYAVAGTYTIIGKVYPNLENKPPSESVAETLSTVGGLPVVKDKNYNHMFEGCSLLRTVNLSRTDTSKITSTVGMFRNCFSIITPPTFDFSSAMDISGMYEGCNNIVTLRFLNLQSDDMEATNVINGCNRLANIIFVGKTRNVNARKIIDAMNDIVQASAVTLMTLSEDINSNGEAIDEINDYQVLQDEQILTGYMASADLYEMMLCMGEDVMPMALEENTPKARMANSMVDIYVKLVSNKKKTTDEVPLVIRSQVLEKLRQKE